MKFMQRGPKILDLRSRRYETDKTTNQNTSYEQPAHAPDILLTDGNIKNRLEIPLQIQIAK